MSVDESAPPPVEMSSSVVEDAELDKHEPAKFGKDEGIVGQGVQGKLTPYPTQLAAAGFGRKVGNRSGPFQELKFVLNHL
jgi:hypothetical protein